MPVIKTSIRRRCPWCYFVRRNGGYLYVRCKMEARHKQRQGKIVGNTARRKQKYRGGFSTLAYNDNILSNNYEYIYNENTCVFPQLKHEYCLCCNPQLYSIHGNYISWKEQYYWMVNNGLI